MLKNMNKKTFDRCYSIARKLSILNDAIFQADENGYLQRVLEAEYKAIQGELWEKAGFHASKFEHMVWCNQKTPNHYKDAKWLVVRLHRTHYLSRELRAKMEGYISLILYGDYADIPF